MFATGVLIGADDLADIVNGKRRSRRRARRRIIQRREAAIGVEKAVLITVGIDIGADDLTDIVDGLGRSGDRGMESAAAVGVSNVQGGVCGGGSAAACCRGVREKPVPRDTAVNIIADNFAGLVYAQRLAAFVSSRSRRRIVKRNVAAVAVEEAMQRTVIVGVSADDLTGTIERKH